MELFKNIKKYPHFDSSFIGEYHKVFDFFNEEKKELLKITVEWYDDKFGVSNTLYTGVTKNKKLFSHDKDILQGTDDLNFPDWARETSRFVFEECSKYYRLRQLFKGVN